LPDMPQKQVYQAAALGFFDQAAESTRQKQHFTLETNFQDEQLVDIVAAFKRSGYTTNMVYMMLKNIKESVSRVNQRIKNGRNYVDHKNISPTHNMSLHRLNNRQQQAGKLSRVALPKP
jgi:predicted ABC-type ATPase